MEGSKYGIAINFTYVSAGITGTACFDYQNPNISS